MPSGMDTASHSIARRFDQRLPLVISITGHRDPVPEQERELQEAVRAILDELDELAPHTPFVVLSPLAKGCDRLFAAACLAHRGRRRLWKDLDSDPRGGIALIAPLPMEQAEYEHDFAAPDDLAEFRSLLARAEHAFSITMPTGLATSDLADERLQDPTGGDRPRRDTQYERLGLFIAMQSNLVVAMWDGTRTGLRGGTSAVVDFCQSGRIAPGTIPYRETIKELEPEDPTPVAWIPTRRAKGSGPAPGSCETAIPLAERIDMTTRAPSCERTRETLNAERRRDDSPQANLLRQLEWLERINRHIADPAVRRRDRDEQPVASLRDAIEASAKALKTRHARAIARFIVLVTATILFLQAATAWSYWPLPALYLAGLIAVLWRLRSLRRSRLEADFADLRLLAEALRVQRAWDEAGIREQVADHYLAHRSLDPALAPIRRTIRSLWITRDAPTRHDPARGDRAIDDSMRTGPTHHDPTRSSDADPLAAIARVRMSWIAGQADYFRRATAPGAPRRRAISKQQRVARVSAVLVVVLAATTLAASVGLSWIDHAAASVAEDNRGNRADSTASPNAGGASDRLEGLLNLTDFLCGASLTIALAFSLWQRSGRESEDLARFEPMARLFSIADERLGECLAEPGAPAPPDDPIAPGGAASAAPSSDARIARARAILRAVGKEALDEQAAWHALHRETLDELPVG